MKTFNEITSNEESCLMIVDAMNLAFRYKHSKARHFVEEYIATVESLGRSYKASKIIIACDKGSSSYRKTILPTYKQGRKDKYEKQTEEEAAAFLAFMEEFEHTIEAIKSTEDWVVLRFDKCEADDIAAYIVKQYHKLYNIWLMSSDKDWDLLINDTVSRFSYVTRKEITANNWHNHYDYTQEEHISIKCLTGDSGDSIPGVEGIGPKRAVDLVNSYGSALDIAASLPIQSKYKYILSLNNFGKDKLLDNYKLMDLLEYCEDALGKDNCNEIDSKLKDYLQ